MALPLIERLAQVQRYEITALVKAPFGQLLREETKLSRIIEIDGGSRFFPTCGGIPLAKMLGAFDIGILTTNSFSTAFHFFHGRVKQRIGFSGKGRGLMLTHPLPHLKSIHKTHLCLKYQRLLAPLGIEVHDISPKLTAPEAVFGEYEEEKRYIGVNPGAAYGSAKCWPPDRFHALAIRLMEDYPEHEILFFGGADHVELIAGIVDGLDRAHSLAGKTSLSHLVGLIAKCEVFISNDSGPMHIAAALNVPTVAIFGSTCPIKTGPYNWQKNPRLQVIQKKVDCAPCFKRTCPIDFKCMKRIEVADILERVEACLGVSEKSPLIEV